MGRKADTHGPACESLLRVKRAFPVDSLLSSNDWLRTCQALGRVCGGAFAGVPITVSFWDRVPPVTGFEDAVLHKPCLTVVHFGPERTAYTR